MLGTDIRRFARLSSGFTPCRLLRYHVRVTEGQWAALASFRGAFSEKCAEWSERASPWLKELQQAAALQGGTPPYPVETPIVYNTALDAVRPEDDIRLIVASDNPGKDEQRAYNRRYLVGQAGKLAARFFALHSELNLDFRKNAIILNKTPIHSARTQQLRFLLKDGGQGFRALLEESERFMAEGAAALRAALGCLLWVIGYSEMRKGGVFASYAETLSGIRASSGGSALESSLFLFQHFSMNRFSIDLNTSRALKGAAGLPLEARLRLLGLAHRREILGW